MLSLLKKIFGTAQSRLLKKYSKILLHVNAWDEKFKFLNDKELKAKTGEFKVRVSSGESLDSLLPEAYAVVKNVCRRLCNTEVHVSGYSQLWDMVPYDVQVLGAIAMHDGKIAEMQTGEGKTLTASLALYLHALTEKPVHLVTVNDYLAQRDCEWIGSIFRWLGLSVEALTQATPHHLRKQVYEADIVYGTASEFGFDYLRDNSMAQSQEEQCQRGRYFAIIDEIDSILIDEARTPLIISGPAAVSRQMYGDLKEDVAQLVRLQKDLCHRLASEARKTLEKYGFFEEEPKEKKWSKEENIEIRESFQKLWLVGKGAPHNKIYKKIRENPTLKSSIEDWDTYFYAEQNKEERLERLATLFMIVDERASEYEITDLGIQTWIEMSNLKSDDFVMLDLGYEYAQIEKNMTLTEEDKLQKKIALREEDCRRKERSHNLRQLFRAHLLMERDVDYIVADNKIIIIDENTGRPQPGRRFSDGLHQAIEAKEGVSIQGETQTLATITLQNYFRMYEQLAGMTGTAITEAAEFKEIYKLEVVEIPTYRPCIRKDENDEIYMTEREKWGAVLKDIQEMNLKGRPILIGTESVEVSEKLSRILRQNKLVHTVLNAKNHGKEAEIIAQAGKKGAITVATNMAGRGTDIKLTPEVVALGGLYVIGSSRHRSRRVDRQFRGRCARLGDPGSSKFYVSLEDDLLRLFASPRITAFLQRFRPPEGQPISAKILNKSIETAQTRLEKQSFTVRKHTLEYDDVMNRQRAEIYSFRNLLLQNAESLTIAEDIIEQICEQMGHKFFTDRSREGGWDGEGYRQWLMSHFPVHFEQSVFDDDYLDLEQIILIAIEKAVDAFRKKIALEAEHIKKMVPAKAEPIDPYSLLKEVVRNILIRTTDRLWQEHLLRVDHLRAEIGLRSLGQKDPLLEFKHEAFALFDHFNLQLKTEMIRTLFDLKTGIAPATPRRIPRNITPFLFQTDLSLLPENSIE
jgi:preprotein translocase subunit SecA